MKSLSIKWSQSCS